MLTQYTKHDSETNTSNTTTVKVTCGGSNLASFIIFDILILLTYWFGVILFSHNENEYMFTLAEKVI